MWINNHDEPEEMTLQEALELLQINGYQPTQDQDGWRCQHPDKGYTYELESEDEVIELAIGEALTYEPLTETSCTTSSTRTP